MHKKRRKPYARARVLTIIVFFFFCTPPQLYYIPVVARRVSSLQRPVIHARLPPKNRLINHPSGNKTGRPTPAASSACLQRTCTYIYVLRYIRAKRTDDGENPAKRARPYMLRRFSIINASRNSTRFSIDGNVRVLYLAKFESRSGTPTDAIGPYTFRNVDEYRKLCSAKVERKLKRPNDYYRRR